MRVLIVGCGYVGMPLATRLAKAGHEVYGLGRSNVPHAEAGSGIGRLQADITRPETLAGLPTSYDWVVLCVASSGGSAEDYARLYFEGSQNVIHWLAPTPPAKLVYTSSTSVYGHDDGSVVDEASPTVPDSATSRILVQTERALLESAHAGDIPAVLLRLAGIYGPGRGYWFRQFVKGEARIEGSGGRYLNMIHRDDVIGATVKALEIAAAGSIYNVVDDEPVTQLEFFSWLSQRLGRPLPARTSSEPQVVRTRGNSNKRVSNRKLRTELGYPLKFPTFRDGYEPEITALQL